MLSCSLPKSCSSTHPLKRSENFTAFLLPVRDDMGADKEDCTEADNLLQWYGLKPAFNGGQWKLFPESNLLFYVIFCCYLITKTDI